MKLVRISKMGPDPSEVHILGGGKVARKIKRKRYRKAERRQR